MNNELNKTFNQITNRYNLDPQKFFFELVECLYSIASTATLPDKYQPLSSPAFDFADAYLDYVSINPWVDSLGQLRDSLGLNRTVHAQHNTPIAVINGIHSLLQPDYSIPRSFSDTSCGTAAITLITMKEALDYALKNNSLSTYGLHYFFLVEIDSITAKIGLIQILTNHIAFSRMNGFTIPLPFIEFINGDGLFIRKGHKLIFSNTERSIKEIPVLKKYALFNEHQTLTSKSS